MKRVGLWAIGVGVLVSVGPLAVEQGYARENEEKCTLATLNGQYLFAGSGMLLPPAVTSPLPTASAGFHIFNGDGTGSDFVTFSLNGIDQHVPSPVAITYTLNPDCTGTYSVPSARIHFDIFVAVDGSALTVIGTDPGQSGLQVLQPRVGSSRRAE
jgi:hypothetical protein